MSEAFIVDELTYRMYRWNREQYSVKPESCYCLWGEALVTEMEQRYREEKRNG